MNLKEVYLLAIGANIAFAAGSLVYAHYSRVFHARWVNLFKALVALIAFGVYFVCNFEFDFFHPLQFWLLFLSGLLGLGIGDVFLLQAFRSFGAGRTIMLFGFQPVIIGVLSYFIFDQSIQANQLLSILIFILCLFTIGLEHFKINKSWEIKGLIAAILGVTLDAVGILLTRYAFDLDPRLSSMEGNFYRCLGAVGAFAFIGYLYPLNLVSFSKKLLKKDWIILILASFAGTFISLGLYLKAVQTGHLASISAIAITGSLFSAGIECIYYKKRPSRYLLTSFALFLLGAFFLF